MNANKITHEARGLCWHEVSKDKRVFEDEKGRCLIRYCVKCEKSWDKCTNITDTEYERGTDYTTPTHYCELMDWMRYGDRWDGFRCWYKFCIEQFLESNRQEQVNLIAEAITEGVLK
jgi:hypothetical protein